MRRLLRLVAAVSLGWPASAAAQHRPSKPLLLACDSFPASLSAADLARRYGTANVAADSINQGEGEFAPGTVLFPDDSTRRVEIVRRDTAAKRRPNFVRVWALRTQWQTPEHITSGTRLRTLEQVNGRPFRLAGFDWDNSGWEISWSGGKLARTTPDGCSFHVGLDYVARDSADARWERQVAGDGEFSSAHPAMQQLDPRVNRMELLYRL